jgi:hypothetical protein
MLPNQLPGKSKTDTGPGTSSNSEGTASLFPRFAQIPVLLYVDEGIFDVPLQT